MKSNIYQVFALIIGIFVGIAAYGSYQAHTKSCNLETSEPEKVIEYVYIESEPEIITDYVYIEKEPEFYRSFTEGDDWYLADIVMREGEGESVVGMLWLMYWAECEKEAKGYETYRQVWESAALASSMNRSGIEPNQNCLEAMALFEEGWMPKPRYFRAGHYHGFAIPLCQVGNHYFSM